MKKLLAAVTVSLLVSSALPTLAVDDADLVGIWKVDVVKMMQMLGQTPPPGTDPAELEKQYAVRVEMKSDGSWSYYTKSPNGEQTQTGRWRTIARDGDTVTIEISNDTDEPQTFRLTFEGKDAVIAAMDNGLQMALQRVK